MANATSDVEAANQQWESQAPYVFEQLQALDESRVNHLRDVLTQLETHEVDQVERNRVTAESCLNALLNIETKDEISTFVARNSNADLSSQRDSRAGARSASSAPSASAELPSLRSTPSRPSAPTFDEDSATASTNHPSPYAPSTKSSAAQGPPPAKSSFGGLRRLGTVLSRPGKSNKGMERISRPASPEKRSRRPNNPLRRGTSAKDMQAIPSPPQTSSSNMPMSGSQLDSLPPPPALQDTSDRPETPSNQNIRGNHMNSTTNGATPTRMTSLPTTNGHQSSHEPSTLENTQSSPSKRFETQRDAEGFSVPPSAADDITRAQQEAAASDENQAAFKLDIRNEPIREEGPEAQSAFSSVANTLRAQAQQVQTPKKPTSNRGRRDVRNTVFVPSGSSVESALGSGSLGGPPPPAVPTFNPTGSPIPAVDNVRGADSQSIRSAHSMSSVAHPTISHPQMHEPGLNASLVETVSATFSQGQVSKAVVIGELALQHNASSTASSATAEEIRLENFPVLEKVAPNPTFITQKSTVSGEYSVNLSQLSRPSVAFKYQVHLDEANLAAHAPITLTPSWKIEPSQASVILSYMFNPAFVSPTQRSVTLKNVMIFINIENAKALSCLSKPTGIFSREKSVIYWKLGDLTLDGYAEAPHKLLARFSTEGEAKPGSVEVRWEIDNGHADGLGSGLGLRVLGGAAAASAAAEGGSDPFADESAAEKISTMGAGTAKAVPVTRRIISGKYTAQ